MLVSAAFLAGCGDGVGGGGVPTAGVTTTSGSSGSSTSGGTQSPALFGEPPPVAVQDMVYSFTPAVSNPNKLRLNYSVSGLPHWARFNAATGRISGAPHPSDLGIYSNIRISVHDGLAAATLDPFSIEVVATATGSVTLSWMPPTERTDGLPLFDLAGYRIYWGTASDDLANSVVIQNPGITTFMIEQLPPATWYFAATAFDTANVESELSGTASKRIM
jgi:hypothetical protein